LTDISCRTAAPGRAAQLHNELLGTFVGEARPFCGIYLSDSAFGTSQHLFRHLESDNVQHVNRRTFLRISGSGVALFSGASASFWKSDYAFAKKSEARPQIALTMDDPSVDIGSQMQWKEANRRILGALNQRKLKSALFVCGMRVDSAEGHELLRAWNDAGHILCNHSYSHLNFNGPRTPYERFIADFQRNEPIISAFPNRANRFRYPGLKEGDTLEKRDSFPKLSCD
jgi:Polysaccharide deacetylase